MTEVHKVVLRIVDHDRLGADAVSNAIEDQRYPNRCISPRVVSIDTREIEWSDDHPLNHARTSKAAFEKLFDAPRVDTIHIKPTAPTRGPSLTGHETPPVPQPSTVYYSDGAFFARTPDGKSHKLAPITGETSDGYHTFNELYDHRITLFIALCSYIAHYSPAEYVWRSKLHSDGTSIDGWFIMGIGDKPGEQISYHVPIARWAEADFLRPSHTRERAPAFDGHTSADVLVRMRRFFR